MTPSTSRPLAGPVLAGLLVATTLWGALAARLSPDGSLVATFWPAAACQVTVLALSPRRRWAAVMAGVVAAVLVGDLLGGRGPRLAVGHAVLEGVGALVAAVVLTHRGRRRPALLDVPDFLRLLAAGLLGGGLIALAGVLGPHFGSSHVAASAGAVLASHVAAVVVLAPLALVTDESHRAGGRYELALQTLLLTTACVLTFVPGGEATVLAHTPVLFLAWAALRFDLRVAVAQLALFACFVTTQTLDGGGPFADLVRRGTVGVLAGGALTQGYLACVALLVLPLAISTQHTASLLTRITSDGLLFRRNFTESLVGMAFVEPDPTGADLLVTDLNDTAVRIFGGHGDDLVGLRLRQLLETGVDYDELLPRLLDRSADGWRADCPLRGPRRGRVSVQLSLLSEPGDPPLFAIQLLDVTAEFQTRRELEVAQQLTATTLDTTACIIMVVDLDGVVVRVNAATIALTGYAEEELLGHPVWDTGVAPADAADVDALMTWPNRSGVPVVREGDVLTRDGEKLRVVWNTNVVRDEDGMPMYAVMTGIDVTAERTTRGLVDHLMEASFTTALVGIDTRGRISVVNSGLTHLLGYDRDELVGQPFHRLLKTSELLDRTGAGTAAGAFATLVRGLGTDGESRPRDWTWVTRDGEDKVVSMSMSVARDTLAAQSGYLCVARDVAEARKSQEMLIAALDKERTAVERLRALDQAKNQFVSTVSHELRTPVTSIVGYAEMMMDGSIVDPLPDQLPLLATIGRNGERLIAMINDLLMLGGLDSGTVQSRHDPLDLAAVVGPVEESVRPLLVGRDLRFEIDRPDGPVPVLGDAAQLERVLTNLVSNAVKFTEDGGSIRIGVSVGAGDEDGSEQAVVRVSDTGIGIPAEEQTELFHRFFRSTTAQSRQIQGTGLGLSIVAEIVVAHGGTIEVDSAHLQGSTFTIRLPLAHSERLTPAG